MTHAVEVKPLQVADLPVVAEIHLRAFPDSALIRLGKEAVRRYYEWQLTGPHQVSACAAFVDGRMAGFYVGGRFKGAMNGFLRKNRTYLVFNVLRKPWLLFNPIFRDRFQFGLKIVRRKPAPAAQAPDTANPAAGKLPFSILSIAVDPQVQGKGVGQALMASAEQEALARGHDQLILTVHPDNHQAVRFYQKLDWYPVPENGQWKGEMRKELSIQHV